MHYSNLDITTFYSLFKGNQTAYGITKLEGISATGKYEGKSKAVYDTPTPAIISKHLSGEVSIGLAPIKEDGTCNFAAIDIDNYKYNLLDIVRAIYDFNLPLNPCYSKSKKLHLYIFFSEDVPAVDVQELLREYLALFALPKTTEIFPKQGKTSVDYSFYSWINLPYYQADNESNTRKMIRRDGSLYSLSEAVQIMNNNKYTLNEHKSILRNLYFYGAPPCVSSGILLRDIGPGQRNDWLYSVGVFLRLQDENADLDSKLTEINNSLYEPLPQEELNATILKGFKNKSYFYKCSVMERCEKIYCKKKEHGIESKSSTGLDYGEMTQYMTDPPYYEWVVNGQVLRFTSELEIIQQMKFKALCMRQLHIVPRKVKEDIWSAILTRACTSMNVVQVDSGVGDFSKGSTFLDLTYKFFNSSRKADNVTQLVLGRIFVDSTTDEYLFTARSFMDFLITKNNFKEYTPIEVRNKLQDLGAYKQGQVWRISRKAIPNISDKVDIEFKSKYAEDENADF